MKKRGLLLIIALVTLLTVFLACGRKPNNGGVSFTGSGSPAVDSKSPVSGDASPAVDRMVIEPTQGVVKNDVAGDVFSTYESEYLGLRITFNPSWVPFNSQDSLDVWGSSMGIPVPYEMSESTSADINLDVLAFTRAVNSSIAIFFERHDSEHQPTVQEVIEKASRGIEHMGGLAFSVPGTIRIGQHDWHSFCTETKGNDTTIMQLHFINIQDGFIRIIMITYTNGADSIDDIMAMFSNLSEPVRTPPVQQPNELVGTWVNEARGYSIVFDPNGQGERRIPGQEVEPFEWGTIGSYDLFTDYGTIIYRSWYMVDGDMLTIANPMNPSYIEAYIRT